MQQLLNGWSEVADYGFWLGVAELRQPGDVSQHRQTHHERLDKQAAQLGVRTGGRRDHSRVLPSQEIRESSSTSFGGGRAKQHEHLIVHGFPIGLAGYSQLEADQRMPPGPNGVVEQRILHGLGHRPLPENGLEQRAFSAEVPADQGEVAPCPFGDGPNRCLFVAMFDEQFLRGSQDRRSRRPPIAPWLTRSLSQGKHDLFIMHLTS